MSIKKNLVTIVERKTVLFLISVPKKHLADIALAVGYNSPSGIDYLPIRILGMNQQNEDVSFPLGCILAEITVSEDKKEGILKRLKEFCGKKRIKLQLRT